MSPRIAIAGLAIESSTFSPHRAGARDFRVLTGDEVIARHAAVTQARDADWVGVLDARSIPGGAVEPEVYADLRGRIVEGLRSAHAAQPLDGIFLDIHGAMSVVGLDDAEGDLITAIRDAVGPGPMISAAMDLHGNVSEVLATQTDLLTCYRMAPHEDAWETKARGLTDLLDALASDARPVRAWVRVPILLPGEKTSTRVEPAASLYARIPALLERDGVTDVSIWVGYAWADEPRCHATVLAHGTDPAACAEVAQELARHMWQVRGEFVFVGPPGTLDEAVDAALAAPERPYLVSDSGDNPGAGGTGDVTWTLTELLKRPELTGPDAPTTLVASIFDAGALARLREHAVGDEVDVEAGARTTPSPAAPVRLRGTLESFHPARPDAGDTAVIRVGGLRAILTQFRKDFHHVDDFTALGLDPAAADLVVTKIGYLEPTLYDLARGWTLALTPGGVDQDLERLGHHRITRPLYPFDAEALPGGGWTPDLTPVLLRGPARPLESR